jgi:allantoicase
VKRNESAAAFTGLVDLAAANFGGKARVTSDDFFAGMENMLAPGRAQFIEGKYTERGKWMDGWESRRKRVAGYDFCVVELGARGHVLGLDIDTQHFVGNHPPFASVEGVLAKEGADLASLQSLHWSELLPQSPLLPDAQNLFAAQPLASPLSHVRLNIFPDGGVARFRVYGRVDPDFATRDVDAETAPRLEQDWVDLAALKNGALALGCSDAFFGPMNNLLLPGRAADMGGGWETRRKRQPGHDFILIKLGARGVVRLVEVDTNHFRGNYPDRCSLELIDAPSARITDLLYSRALRTLVPEQKLSAHTRHFFVPEQTGAATHVRLNIFPDGGVSRLRLWGQLA